MAFPLRIVLAVGVGVSIGVAGDPAWAAWAQWLVAGGVAVGSAGAGGRAPRVTGIAAMTTLTALSCVLGAAALDRALHTPLRARLEERLGGFAIEGADGGRPQAPLQLEGRLRADASPTETGVVLRLDVTRVWIGAAPEAAEGGVSLSVGGTTSPAVVGQWRTGRVLRVSAWLRRPARYLDVGVPDEERALARRGVSLVGTVKSAALVEVMARGAWIDERAASVRVAVRAAMSRWVSVYSAQSGAIATAILIGDRTGLDADVQRRLQEAGTYHVIAISGGNVAILAGAVLACLWAFRVRGAAAAATAALLVVAYAVVAEGGPSVGRATVMGATYLGLRLFDQRTAPANAMALAATAITVADPLAIVDVGFWLTFGAAGALVAGTPRLPQPERAWVRGPALLVLASACVEVALLPVGALVFHRVTLAGLLLNLIAVPCMAVAQVAAMGVAALDVAGLDTLARIGGWVTHMAVRALTESATLVDLAPWLVWRVPPPGAGVVAAYFAALGAWWHTSRPPVDAAWRRHASRAAGSVSIVLLLWIAVSPATLVRARGDGRLHLTALDVGQGDALLVTLPNGRQLMVDTGGVSVRGDFDIGDRVVGPALRTRGIRRLDALAISHSHPDHIGGAPSVLRDFGPGDVWVGVPVPPDAATMALHEAAIGRHAAWRALQRGDRLDWGGVELRVHHPPLPDWERQEVRNDDSLVFELRFGRVSMLLTGDIGRDVERQIIPSLDLLPLVVLKVPHHGSATSSSSEFVTAVRPAVVVVSCGRGNAYGHPVPAVLDRYRAVGAEVFRTDQDGQVEVVTDGRTIETATYTGRWVQRK